MVGIGRVAYTLPAGKDNIMYHKASFDAGKLTRSIIISLLQAAVSLAVAYVMYVGIWMVHYGK